MSFKWIAFAVLAVALGVGGSMLTMRLKSRSAASAHGTAGALVLDTGGGVVVSGKIRPQHVTSVKADIDGNIDSFDVEVGQDVIEGEVLAHIGSSGLQDARTSAEEALSAAKEQVESAERAVADARVGSSRADADRQRSRAAFDGIAAEYHRQEMLFTKGATARLKFQSAQKDYDSARQDLDIMDKAARAAADHLQATLNNLTAAQRVLTARTQELDDAQDNLQTAELRSPVDGVVIARGGEVGQPAAGELFSIATDMFALEVALEPNAETLPRLVPGQPAMVVIPDLQGAGMQGQVKEIQDKQVIVEFQNTLPAIKPGMLADVHFKLN
jgi:multidrug resistance efflux pump